MNRHNWNDHAFSIFTRALDMGTYEFSSMSLYMFLYKQPCTHYGFYVKTDNGVTYAHLDSEELKMLPFDWTRFKFVPFNEGDIMGVMQMA